MREEDEVITVKEAEQMVKDAGVRISRMTLYNWLRKFELGYQIGGSGFYNPWRIYKNRLERHLKGLTNDHEPTEQEG